MSQENVEIIRAIWEPFKGMDATEIDWEAEAIREMLVAQYSPEVELRWAATGPESRVYEYRAEPLDYIDAGDCVVVPMRQWGIGATSGVPVEIEVTHVYEFQGHQITRLDEYDTLKEALGAVGLRE